MGFILHNGLTSSHFSSLARTLESDTMSSHSATHDTHSTTLTDDSPVQSSDSDKCQWHCVTVAEAAQSTHTLTDTARPFHKRKADMDGYKLHTQVYTHAHLIIYSFTDIHIKNSLTKERRALPHSLLYIVVESKKEKKNRLKISLLLSTTLQSQFIST